MSCKQGDDDKNQQILNLKPPPPPRLNNLDRLNLRVNCPRCALASFQKRCFLLFLSSLFSSRHESEPLCSLVESCSGAKDRGQTRADWETGASCFWQEALGGWRRVFSEKSCVRDDTRAGPLDLMRPDWLLHPAASSFPSRCTLSDRPNPLNKVLPSISNLGDAGPLDRPASRRSSHFAPFFSFELTSPVSIHQK